jgi:pimeloyl-ACP methyl ester carboxylesterase
MRSAAYNLPILYGADMTLSLRSTLSILAALALASPLARAAQDHPSAACKPGQPIHESGYVNIGGIEQWISIDGADCAKPALLLVHGGPGNPISVYQNGPYDAWTRDYVVIHWDQRAAGLTWARNAPSEDTLLSLAQMRDDGIALSRHLLTRLGKRKLVLLGSSWGSILGGHMAARSPELYCAWMPVAQVVDSVQTMRASREIILARARAAQDGATVEKIEALGAPPWTNPRNFGILRRAIRKYEATVADPAPAAWLEWKAARSTPKARADYEAAEDYSYIQFVGMKGDGIASSVDMMRQAVDFRVPVYMVHGEHDLLAPKEIAQRYFDRITAPRKQLEIVARAGHDPNLPLVEAQARMLAKQLGGRCE